MYNFSKVNAFFFPHSITVILCSEKEHLLLL